MAATAAVYSRLHNSSVGVGGSGVGSSISGNSSSSISHHSQLARSLERILEEAHMSGELILTNRKLKDFPKTCTKYNLEDTVIADLSRNRFCELPEEITSFAFLETLLLYHNTIRNIPASVGHLTSLTYLDLRSNQLAALPRELCFLPLQVLLVSNNRLASLPDELGRMDRMTDLDASYNQLTALPPRIGELRSLRAFSLRNNQLMYLPRELTCLTLVSLDISNNRIASLPLEMRHMSTLVEFNLENNPLTSPPASLCVRGLVHVFKFLETQAIKDEKGTRAGGNYDGYTTLRRVPRHNSSAGALETARIARHAMDTGYNTCDGIDKRWSHDMPSVKASKIESSPSRKAPYTAPSSLSSELMDASLSSSTNTIVDENLSKASSSAGSPAHLSSQESLSRLTASPTKQPKQDANSSQILQQHISFAQSSNSSSSIGSGSSPEQEDIMLGDNQQQQQQQQQQQPNGKTLDEKSNKNLGNIQTYREYKEALKQQRNQEINVYKSKGQKSQSNEAINNAHVNSQNINPQEEIIEVRFNGITTNAPLPKSIMKSGSAAKALNGLNNQQQHNGSAGFIDDAVIIPKKPIQKVIPSRNTELMEKQQLNGDCLGYVKPSSPMKTATANGGGAVNAVGGGILTNNNKFSTSVGLKSPNSNSTTKLGTTKPNRTVTWNHDIPAEKLSFTMRREFDRQREETELMTQLRSIIETRLKMTLPEDIASALTDGVILCHLANYVRPRSVASIHVPSPGVSKLTMARCRRNVDNFLEACRKIGVDEELICSCADVVPPSAPLPSADNQANNYDNTQTCNMECQTLPNPSAVLKTVAALIAMDCNPHHQNIRNLQQQEELQKRLRQLQQQQQHEQQLTATCTKEQMLLQQEHEIVANLALQNNDNFNCNGNTLLKCHFENTVYANGHAQPHERAEETHDTTDAANIDDDATLLMSQSQHFCNASKQVFRNAKFKTFQKIKLNLITSHGNNSNKSKCSNSSTDHCTALATTLQTIVETENDAAAGGTDGGLYQLINEKPQLMQELPLNVNGKSSAAYKDNYKLLEVSMLNQKQLGEMEKIANTTATTATATTTTTTVSKRIEFFEHSKMNANVIPKFKNKTGIFSIYNSNAANNTNNMDNHKLAKKIIDCDVDTAKATSSTLLKHDSHVLTVILSCVFIVTFLLLVIFPLPG